MISFYPGPSKVYDKVPMWVKKAHSKGYLSMNHRSERFEDLMQKTQRKLRQNLNIPENYSCFFTSSATECWEIIAESLVKNATSHIYSGAFGKKWFQYTKKLKPEAVGYHFDFQKPLSIDGLQQIASSELIAITQNETSNGTQVSCNLVEDMHMEFPDSLIALDVTSSLGGIELPWEAGDIWFASVQKCLGLPAGMGIMICSPRTLIRARALGFNEHYNSLISMDHHMSKFQTTHTPNVLGLYLLYQVLSHTNSMDSIQQKIERRFAQWMNFIATLKTLKPLVSNPEVQSHTVITLKSSPENIENVLNASRKKGFDIGLGYGELKPSTLRIANFPALKRQEIIDLQNFWRSQEY